MKLGNNNSYFELSLYVDSPLHVVPSPKHNDTKKFQLTIYFYKKDYKALGSSFE